MTEFYSSIMLWSSDISAECNKVKSGSITHNILYIRGMGNNTTGGINMILNDQQLKEIYRALRECQIEK